MADNPYVFRKLSPTSPATGLRECAQFDHHNAQRRPGGVYATGWQAICVDHAKRKISRKARRAAKGGAK